MRRAFLHLMSWSRTCLIVATGCGPSAATVVPVAPPAIPFTAVHATHGRPIEGLAVTAAGDAAVTSDEDGALRLWPTLDGTREPIVITGALPRELAIASVGTDGFAVATLDAAQTIEIRGWSVRGEPRSHLQLDLPALQIAAIPDGFLVLHEDRTIDIIDVHGERRARLAPDAGSRPLSLVVREGRALAMIATRDQVRGRWIDLGHDVWGDTTPPLTLDAATVVLSPDHKTIAGLDDTTRQAVVVDAVTGVVSKARTCGGVPPQASFPIAPLGFYDAKTIVCGQRGMMSWWNLEGRALAVTEIGRPTGGATEFVPGRIITAREQELVFESPEHVTHLGYGIDDFQHVRYTARGIIVSWPGQRAAMLDPDFRALPPIALPPEAVAWLDVIPIDARYVLAMVNGVGETVDKQIGVYDTQTHSMGPLVPCNGARNPQLTYEPSTGLVLSTEPDLRLAVRRLDPIARTLGEPTYLETPLAFLVDPTLARGVAVLAIVPGTQALAVTEIPATELAAGHGHHASYHLRGEFRGFDRAGRLYLTAADDVVVYDRGEPTISIPDVAGSMIRPSPDGASIAVLGDHKLSLFDHRASLRWSVPAWDATDVQWTGDALIAQFASAFARFDIATGAYAARQCGWGFGLSTMAPTNVTFPTPPRGGNGLVCDVAP